MSTVRGAHPSGLRPLRCAAHRPVRRLGLPQVCRLRHRAVLPYTAGAVRLRALWANKKDGDNFRVTNFHIL
jgi:hypothetical protein